MTLEDYISFYKRSGKFPDQIQKPKKQYSQTEIESRYKKFMEKSRRRYDSGLKYATKYKESLKTKIIKGSNSDNKWVRTKELVFKRAKGKCEIFPNLTEEERRFFFKNSFGELLTLDNMHIISRSECRYDELYYNPDNIILGYRFFHCIDHFIDPFSRTSITQEDKNNFFIRFIGLKRWNRLHELKKSLIDRYR